jgi:hypothetical protein
LEFLTKSTECFWQPNLYGWCFLNAERLVSFDISSKETETIQWMKEKWKRYQVKHSSCNALNQFNGSGKIKRFCLISEIFM